jgi:ABC-type dipeptide/oligopeptide/nickel transport system permease subunit
MREDFIKLARAKGLSESAVILRHAVRPALNPLLTIAGLSLGGVLGGSVIVESVLGRQGLGTLMVSAVRARDLPLVMGIVFLPVQRFGSEMPLASCCRRSTTSEFATSAFERTSIKRWFHQAANRSRCGLWLARYRAVRVVAVFAGFLAPYDHSAQSRFEPSAPATTIHFSGLTPIIHPRRVEDPLRRTYTEDTSVAFPLGFFVRGYSYKLLGIGETDVHLFRG